MNDLRYAFRQLFKEPRFTIVAVLALAIGIGANTAIFSVINAVLLKPLPFPHPKQLVAWGSIDSRLPQREGFRSVSYPDFFDFRKQNKSFAYLATYLERSLALSGEGAAQSLRGAVVSGEFSEFSVFIPCSVALLHWPRSSPAAARRVSGSSWDTRFG